ncbi:MAG TPA: Rho termination factor N-terminal domain-containing protein, partial [Spirochaetia bacterium]|nr:Rho termination factor N-terminal domain-containing protein [Spirochaetia bacterium]
MGTSDQDNDSSLPPSDSQSEMDSTGDSLLNGDNGDPQPNGAPGHVEGQGHRPKRRIARRKIRVELIKEPAAGQPEEASDSAAVETVPEPPRESLAPLPPGSLPPTGAAYAAAAAPANAGVSATNGDAVKDKLLTQSDNRLHINDLSQMSMPDLRGMASKMGVNHEALVSMKKQEIIFQILKGHTERGGVIYAYGALEILPDGYGFLRSPNYSYLP